MKRALILGLSCFFVAASLPAAPLEFVAVVEGVSEVDDETILEVRLTPAATLDVRVTALTEVKDETGLPIPAEDLAPGQTVEIEAIFTDQGILALEIEVLGDDTEFEFRGRVESVGDGSIGLLGLTILVPDTADIKDETGNLLALEDLMVGDLVKVEGMTDGDDLVATDIRRLSEDSFARISFLGVIESIPADDQIMVTLDGGVDVLVEITDETDVRGTLTEGALVRVIGLINPELFVTALKIKVISALFELSPPKLRLDPSETRTVDVILHQPLEEDLVLQIVSADPNVAQVSPEELVIPAGELTASFEVTAGSEEGETTITLMVAGNGVGAGLSVTLEVEVAEEDDHDEDDLAIKWTPRVIGAARQGTREVSIFVKQGRAPTDLPIALSLVEGPPTLVTFPEEVVIPEGQHRVFFEIEIHAQPGQAVIRAELPEELGGATDELVVELAPGQVKTRLHWSPSRVTTGPESDVEVELRLERPAPFPIAVSIERLNGDAGVVSAFPEEVVFEEGEDEVTVEFSTTEHTGKVTYRARVPSDLGNAHADLRITVK